jgi:hypothetical protein
MEITNSVSFETKMIFFKKNWFSDWVNCLQVYEFRQSLNVPGKCPWQSKTWQSSAKHPAKEKNNIWATSIHLDRKQKQWAVCFCDANTDIEVILFPVQSIPIHLSPHGSLPFQFDGFFFQLSAIAVRAAAVQMDNKSNKMSKISHWNPTH